MNVNQPRRRTVSIIPYVLSSQHRIRYRPAPTGRGVTLKALFPRRVRTDIATRNFIRIPTRRAKRPKNKRFWERFSLFDVRQFWRKYFSAVVRLIAFAPRTDTRTDKVFHPRVQNWIGRKKRFRRKKTYSIKLIDCLLR